MKEENSIAEEWKSLNSPLASLPRTMPFSVPANYFDELTESINDEINATRFEMSKNSVETPFVAPSGYFESLPASMLELVRAENKTTKRGGIISFPGVRWAAAAAIAVIICAGGYITFVSSNKTQSEKMLSSIPGSDIKEYVQHSYGLDAGKIIDNTDVSMQTIEPKDIVKYLNETGWE